MLQQRNLPKLPASRDEMLKILAEQEYGYIPPAPVSVSAADTDDKTAEKIICGGHGVYEKKLLTAHMPEFSVSFPVRCVFPKNIPEGGVPAFVFINFRPEVPDWYFPAEEIVENGFAVLTVYYNEVTQDTDDGYTSGIAPAMCGVYGPTSKISLWAWACSRALDYALTRPEIDAKRIAVIGHSRLGKTALWAGANDDRFALVCSNDSGCSGAAISRGKQGESIEAITRVFPYWSVDAYKQYVGRENDAPFDQHFLLAAIAPRKLCVDSASEDLWADPASEYLSCCAASEAWERNGKTGFVHPDRLPETGETFSEGSVSYYLREGGHYLARSDWKHYMDILTKD